MLCDPQVVAYEHHGFSLFCGQFMQQLDDRDSGLRIEISGGLIGQDNGRGGGHGLGRCL